jgi:hypothetical protein
MERGEKGSEIRVRQIDAAGVAQPSAVVSGASGVRPGAFARIERSGNKAFIAWTSAGVSQVRVATVDLTR